MAKTRKARKAPLLDINLDELVDLLKIVDWDVLLVGDGSGNGWSKPCGWGVALIDRMTSRRELFKGAWNFGTIGVAEVMPYFQAMLWYHETMANVLRDRLRIASRSRPIRVHIVTDCQQVAEQGRALSQGLKSLREVRQNRPLWHGLMQFEREGFQFDFHFLPRTTIALNILADAVANSGRVAIRDSEDEGDAHRMYICNGDVRAAARRID